MINQQAQEFLELIFKRLAEAKVDIDGLEIDHLCYRTSSLSNYAESKEVFSKLGELLIESEVNGRDIATYKLFKPIIFKEYKISLIEVPAPKMGAQTIEGFEHIEVVTSESFDEIMENYPQLNFETKALSKKINPELVIKFGDCSLKFHHQSLEDVIKQELLELK